MLDELKRLAEAATPGPWFAWGPEPSATINPEGAMFVQGPKRMYVDRAPGMRAEDAIYIAALSPELVLALIACVEAAKAMREDLWAENSRREAFDAALSALEEGK